MSETETSLDQLAADFRGSLRSLVGKLRRQTMVEWRISDARTEGGLESVVLRPFLGGEPYESLPPELWKHAALVAEHQNLRAILSVPDQLIRVIYQPATIRVG